MSRQRITEAIQAGQYLRVQTRTKTVLLRPYQCGTIGGRWCFDAYVVYMRHRTIETFYESELVAVQAHDSAKGISAQTLESIATRFDRGSLIRYEKQ